MNDESFPDMQGKLREIMELANRMLNRDAKWNRKNKTDLMAKLKTFIQKNGTIKGDKKYLFGISLNGLIKQISNSLIHTNKSLFYTLNDLLKILEEIQSKEILRLETFEKFTKYVMTHKLIQTNKKIQYARLKFSIEQEKILKYGLSKDWDRKLVEALIKKNKGTDEFELFKVYNENRLESFIFYRFYTDNLKAVKPDVSYLMHEGKKELTMKIPIYKAQIDLFENEIKQMALEKIQDYYMDVHKKKVKARPIIKEVSQRTDSFNKVLTTVQFIYWDRNDAQTREVENKDGFSIYL